MVLLAKLEETLIIGSERYELSCNQYPGAIHPQGHCCLRQFRLGPFPIFTYEVEGLVIEKCLFIVHGENTTVIEYGLVKGITAGQRPLSLELRPLIAFRDYHSTTHEGLAVFRGNALMRFGISINDNSDDGIELTVKVGDVIVIPAGVAHCALKESGGFSMVGAYPEVIGNVIHFC